MVITIHVVIIYQYVQIDKFVHLGLVKFYKNYISKILTNKVGIHELN